MSLASHGPAVGFGGKLVLAAGQTTGVLLGLAAMVLSVCGMGGRLTASLPAGRYLAAVTAAAMLAAITHAAIDRRGGRMRWVARWAPGSALLVIAVALGSATPTMWALAPGMGVVVTEEFLAPLAARGVRRRFAGRPGGTLARILFVLRTGGAAGRLVAPRREIAPRPGVVRQHRCLRRGNQWTWEGWCRAGIPAGCRHWVEHVVFCPPLETTPQVRCRVVAGAAARLRVLRALPQGTAFEIRLRSALRRRSSVTFAYRAVAASRVASESLGL